MLKISFLFLLGLYVAQATAQKEHKLVGYLQAQFNETIKDETIGNNPRGMGLGFQAFFHNPSAFSPTLEITGDKYFEDDKVYRLYGDLVPIPTVEGMANIFAGVAYQPQRQWLLSFTGGPSFIGGNTYLGLKPSVAFFFSPNQRWMAKISYIDVLHRSEASRIDFQSVSVSIGLKLF